jgi:transposase
MGAEFRKSASNRPAGTRLAVGLGSAVSGSGVTAAGSGVTVAGSGVAAGPVGIVGSSSGAGLSGAGVAVVGSDVAVAGSALGASRRAAANWCRRQALGGDASVAARRRGRRSSEQRALPAQHELDLVAMLRTNLPDQLGLPGQLWTRQGVAVMIERSYGIQLSTQSVGRYLRSWGLGPRKPIERAGSTAPNPAPTWSRRSPTAATSGS